MSQHYDLLLSDSQKIVLWNCQHTPTQLLAGAAYFGANAPAVTVVSPDDNKQLRVPIKIPDRYQFKPTRLLEGDADFGGSIPFEIIQPR